jgi:signal transduction histidine kinase/ligand-binding sensor domain-containing protein
LKQLVFFTLFLCVFANDLSAQIDVEFKRYGMEDGFSDITFRSALQDRDGFLWFGTLNGLNRFDGKKVKVYKNIPGDPHSLAHNKIMKLDEDSLGYIWVFTYNKDILRLDKQTDSFVNINKLYSDSSGNPFQATNYYESSPGVIWIFSRFDGLLRITEEKGQGKGFRLDKIDNSNVLNHNSVRFVRKDRMGFVWIGTAQGLVRLENDTVPDIKKGSESFFATDMPMQFTNFCETERGIWFGTNDDGLLFYSFSTHELNKEPQYGINTPIRSIKAGKENDLLVTTMGQGLFYITQHGKQHIHLKPNATWGGKVQQNYYLAYCDNYGKFWIRTEKRGVSLFDPETKTIKHYGLNPEIRESAGESDAAIFFEDSYGTLWIALYGGGLCKLDREKMEFEQFFYERNNPYSLSSNLALLIFEDHSKNLWIGTYQGGLSKIELRKYPFNFTMPYKNPIFQSFNEVRAVMVDRYDRKWVGTKEGHILCFNSDHQEIFKIPDDIGLNPGYLKSNVYELHEDSSGNLWIGTKGSGLYKIQGLLSSGQLLKKKYEISNYRYSNGTPLHSLSRDDVYAIHQDHLGQLWIGTYHGGLNLMENINKEEFKKYQHSADHQSLSDNRVRYIMQDSRKNLWVCTANGINLLHAQHLSEKDKPFTRFLAAVDNKKNETGADIICAKEDADGNIWLGTYGSGLFKLAYRVDSNKYVLEANYLKIDGLPSDVICSIEEDFSGNLWLGTDFGLCKFSPKNKRVENYFKEEGLGDNLFSEGASDISSQGMLIFGQKNGFISYRPHIVKKDTLFYNVLLTELKIFNKVVTPNSEGSPLSKRIEYTKRLQLKHYQNFLEFEYVILDFMGHEKCNYRHKMTGVDKDWVYTGNLNSTTYTNLEPGSYIFNVEATNHDGIWSNKSVSLEITITPPFYRTTWFKILFILLLLALIFAMYFIRVGSLKKQKKQLEFLVSERTHEIEEQKKVLETRQKYIEEQSEELIAQKEILEINIEDLNEVNTLLEEKQQKIEEQSEELRVQAEDLSAKNSELQLLNATKDKLFSIIAHDLKNPFNSILGFCNIIVNKYDTMDQDRIKHLLGVIYSSAKSVYNLLENLLHWSRSQSGSIQFIPETLNLKTIIEENMGLIENMAEQKNIRCILNVDERIEVYADRNMINTVLRNLLNNSIKYTEKGTLTISSIQNISHAVIEITDTGTGIPPDKLDMLFEIEKSKSTEGTRGEQGTGLGLIICKEFVVKNGGIIYAKSKEGKGSTFGFTLPVNPK